MEIFVRKFISLSFFGEVCFVFISIKLKAITCAEHKPTISNNKFISLWLAWFERQLTIDSSLWKFKPRVENYGLIVCNWFSNKSKREREREKTHRKLDTAFCQPVFRNEFFSLANKQQPLKMWTVTRPKTHPNARIDIVSCGVWDFDSGWSKHTDDTRQLYMAISSKHFHHLLTVSITQ